jgi:hypothetical protein
MKYLIKVSSAVLSIALLSFGAFSQTERLTNSHIVEMTKVGLDPAIIIMKIDESDATFDLTTAALIELRKNGVDNAVITKMTEKRIVAPTESQPTNGQTGFSENVPAVSSEKIPATVNAAEAFRNAKTVAIEKSSLNPSRQSLEKALMKRADWRKHNLTLIRYKQDADIYIEIGRVPLSWITHRYVFRIYDRRTGTIITAGETTSWGSLAENMAREITQKLAKIGVE